MTLVRAEQISANDEDVLVLEWAPTDGDQVRAGEVVGTLETTKAVLELESPAGGFFRPLVGEGERVAVGGALYAITDTVDEVVSLDQSALPSTEPDAVSERGWTKKAELLAAKHGADISRIPATGVVREADVERFLQDRGVTEGDLVDDVYHGTCAERILVIGGGRGAAQTLDALTRIPGKRPMGIVDDNARITGRRMMGLEILGTREIVPRLLEEGAFDAAIIAFSNDLDARARVFEELTAAGVPFTNVIDPEALVHSNVELGTGNLILANVRLGSCTKLGDNNFLSAGVHIEHHNVLGNHTTFGPGVFTSSRVSIGDRCRFGTGIFMEPGVRIGDECIVASGSIITRDIPARSIVKVRVETLVRSRDREEKETPADQ